MLKSLILRICVSLFSMNVTGEWAFWKLELIKNCYQITMTEKNIDLVLTSAEHELIKQLDFSTIDFQLKVETTKKSMPTILHASTV